MANVEFYQGTRAQLNNYPLDLGTIYFIPEERRLYIDTIEKSKPKRIPVIGYSGLSFYLQLEIDLGTPKDDDPNKIDFIINQYLESTSTKIYSEKDFVSKNLSEILGDNSIVYSGYPYYFYNGEFKKYDNSYLNFYIESISNGEIEIVKEKIKLEEVVEAENAPNFIYLYCYCPNPLPTSFEIPVNYTVYSQTITLYGAKNRNNNIGWTWNENEKIYEYNVDFSSGDIDLRDYPFIIKPNDDSLENYMEWDGRIYLKDLQSTNGKIRFYISTSSELPWFNIEIDILAFIGEESSIGQWRGKNYNIITDWDYSSNGNNFTLTAKASFADFLNSSTFIEANLDKDSLVDDTKHSSL